MSDNELLNTMGTELFVLWSAWFIAGDDDRRRKLLSVSPTMARRWKKLAAEAGQRIGHVHPALVDHSGRKS